LGLTLSGCGRIAFSPLAGDGGASDGAVDAAPPCAQFGPWSAPVRIDALASDEYDWEPALHPSGSPLIYGTTGNAGEMYEATRMGATFGSPRPMTEFNDSQYRTGGATWMPSGDELYFVSVMSGNPRLYSSKYVNGTFQPGTLVAGLETTYVNAPAIAPSGLELYFDDDSMPMPGRIFRATRPSLTAPWTVTGMQSQLDPGSGPYGWPTVSGDSLTLYYEGGSPAARIYTATRTDPSQSFGAAAELLELSAMPLVTASTTGVGDPEITPDGRTLLVALDDPNLTTQADLYVLTRSCQ